MAICCGVVTMTAPLMAAAQSINPLTLPQAAPVQLAGSDAEARIFQSVYLPKIAHLVNTNLAEQAPLRNATAHMLNPSQLRLSADSSARVYFVGEGAGYHNTLLMNYFSAGKKDDNYGLFAPAVNANSKIVFRDASSNSTYLGNTVFGTRTVSAPLLPGDFVDLGPFAARGLLDFTIVANGAYGGQNAFTTLPSRNPDHITHVVAYALENSPFLVVAFEDLFGGGDRDYNDLVIAVNIGVRNVAALVAAPSPSAWLSMAGMAAIAAYYRRRRTALA